MPNKKQVKSLIQLWALHFPWMKMSANDCTLWCVVRQEGVPITILIKSAITAETQPLQPGQHFEKREEIFLNEIESLFPDHK